ncbi:hypothetical protein MIV013L [Invertebrate iridescent virus 3]|uniref:Uncharacterized protein IIV3-013L n=1 Tax=Invertebrate iridescent virus 3 TaxID=345201 RepID=013L_IIV3|nr:hypothetical protein MIV013L [Invertebrate iridescent virus 3]Q197E7.1 RecName: Full=Uncharacterized protein IIV3-013L [Invertebrate iridescent virus 3]ABF82043.1 hypothetical protein MIV013L [Invertebrate iridescent virus 3]
MYYRDQYGNVKYAPEGMGPHHAASSSHHSAQHHHMTKENFSMDDVHSWFEKYKMWFLYALILALIFGVFMWWSKYNHDKKRSLNTASIFY